MEDDADDAEYAGCIDAVVAGDAKMPIMRQGKEKKQKQRQSRQGCDQTKPDQRLSN